MLDIADVCNLYAWLYSKLPVPPGTWDHVIATDGAYTAIKRIDGISYVMFRGSTTFLDWVEDLTRVTEPLYDPLLGPVHPGFCLGVRAVKNAIDVFVADDPVVIVGHSLGAGHAAIYAGYRIAAGKTVDRILMFGEPRPGGEKLAEILKDTPIWSYRNGDTAGHDYVTDVPIGIPPLLDYRHPKPLTNVSRSPTPGDAWLAFRYHHFRLYCEALGATGPAVQSLAI